MYRLLKKEVIKKALIAALLFVGSMPSLLFAEEVQQEESLPKVLIIGDSISLHYTPYVTESLKGKAIVKHHKGNAGPTMRGLANIEKWLGDTEWDVIHFNWGLWDIYGWPYYHIDRSPAMYKKRLEQLVTRLKKTGAKLIWATTTPVCPAPERTMIKQHKKEIVILADTEKEYLDAAQEVMEKFSVRINDLHSFMKDKRSKYALADNDVHYTAEGRKLQGEQVAKQITAALNHD